MQSREQNLRRFEKNGKRARSRKRRKGRLQRKRVGRALTRDHLRPRTKHRRLRPHPVHSMLRFLLASCHHLSRMRAPRCPPTCTTLRPPLLPWNRCSSTRRRYMRATLLSQGIPNPCIRLSNVKHRFGLRITRMKPKRTLMPRLRRQPNPIANTVLLRIEPIEPISSINIPFFSSKENL